MATRVVPRPPRCRVETFQARPESSYDTPPRCQSAIFFGLWLAPLGYLAYRSGWFPKALAVVLVAACASYIVDLLAAFLVPDFGRAIHGFASILPAIAEPWMVVYLLVIGVRTVKTSKAEKRFLAAA